MRVLIGYDGSQCAEAAIADLHRAGFPDNETEVLLFAVWDGIPSPPTLEPASGAPPVAAVILREVERLRALAREAVERTHATAEREAGRVRELFPAWSVHSEARADAPHWALVAKAAEWHADLIVVGSHGRSALGRMLLGSVSQKVLRYSACSVRVGRCDAERARPVEPRVRLVLGIDGSEDSATAALAVSARHWPAGTEVLVVGVLDGRVMLNYLEPAPPQRPSRRAASAAATTGLQGSLQRVCDDLRRSGLSATASFLLGDPKRVLLQEAERIGADCIFVGAKGHSMLERIVLGSVSSAIAARAHCSVEVVRHGC